MRPKLKHKIYGNGERLCGDTTKNTYITDKEYSILRECPHCFPLLISDKTSPNYSPLINTEEKSGEGTISMRKRFLRDYLMNER